MAARSTGRLDAPSFGPSGGNPTEKVNVIFERVEAYAFRDNGFANIIFDICEVSPDLPEAA